jgi:hypothetical protein
MKSAIVFGLLACLALPSTAAPRGNVAQDVSAPATAKVATPIFQADTSEVPELEAWGYVAEALCQVWYPKVSAILRTDDSARPPLGVVKIYFKKDMKGVAHAAGGNLYIAADWVKAHPTDFGMVVHELTHLVQRYPSYNAGWLVEGIADYVRGYHFEPAVTHPRIDFTRAKYTDAYKTTAAFLKWVSDKYDKDLVPKLSNALGQGKYSDTLFKEYTSKDVTALWSEFAAAPATTPAAEK